MWWTLRLCATTTDYSYPHSPGWILVMSIGNITRGKTSSPWRVCVWLLVTFYLLNLLLSDIYLMDFFEIFLVILSNSYKSFESRLPTLDKVSGILLCSLCTFLWLMYILLTYERTFSCIDTQVLIVFFHILGIVIFLIWTALNVVFTVLSDQLGYGQLFDKGIHYQVGLCCKHWRMSSFI